MKIKTLLLAVATMVALPSFAVKGVEDEKSKYGTGEDSIRCLENLSLYTNYYKIKEDIACNDARYGTRTNSRRIGKENWYAY